MDNINNGPVPDELLNLPRPENPLQEPRTFEYNFIDEKALINGVGFADVENRVLAKPQLGNVQRWILTKPTGAIHPVHVQLVDF